VLQRELGYILCFSREKALLSLFLLCLFFLAAKLCEIDVTAKDYKHEQQNRCSLETHYFLRLAQTKTPAIRTEPGNKIITTNATVRPPLSVIVSGRSEGLFVLMEMKFSSRASHFTVFTKR